MEQNKAGKNLILWICIGIIVIGAPIGYWAYQTFKKPEIPKPPETPPPPLSDYIKSDLPILELDIQLINVHNQKIQPQVSRLIETAPDKQKTPPVIPQNCPELKGGDIYDPTIIYDTYETEEEQPKDCPKIAKWYVKCHPIGFSLYFQDAEKILSALKDDPEIKKFYESKLVQGIFYDAIRSLNIRAEDIDPEGLKGAFLAKMVTQAMAAHGEIHYDVVHGKKGFVFSFVRHECPFASTALPLMIRYLARTGYKIPKLKEPIIETKIGVMRVFLTQYEDRIYLSNGLESLLNVIESLNKPENLPKSAFTISVRGQAFLDNILQVIVGDPKWEARLGFNFSKDSPGVLQLDSGKFAKHFRPKIFKGVSASIPHDVFGAVITSLYLSPDMTDNQWQELTTAGPSNTPQGPEEAGFAIIWDMNAENSRISEIGIVIANPTTPEKSAQFKRYFAQDELTAECSGGTMFLAATSNTLLTRMKESCEKQSLSILDWERGEKSKQLDAAQIAVFVNPKIGIREIFLAGEPKTEEIDDEETQPEWKKEYIKAKEFMQRDTDAVISTIPIIAYSGAADTTPIITLQGFTVKQGGLK